VNVPNPLPRELAPGVFWLGACLLQMWQGRLIHGYNSAFLVCGDDASLLVDAGHPKDLPVIEAQLDALLHAGAPELRYVFCTHQETPHASGIGRWLSRFPELTVCGDVRDFHLVFPQFEHRLRILAPGESIDLGGTQVRLVESVIRDYISTLWAFDTRRHVLFPGDGFAYSHYHDPSHCGKVAEEAPELDLPDMTAVFAELALYWTRFSDMEPYIERLDGMLDELGVELIAPTHGLPITDLVRALPRVREGLRFGSTSRTEGALQ
jgi:flavorubredoxin